MMRYFPTAVERAMMIQKVIIQAQHGEIKWKQAAKILKDVKQKPSALEEKRSGAWL
jgi:uncharacterized membrane protein YjjP (DUF1212 family)